MSGKNQQTLFDVWRCQPSTSAEKEQSEAKCKSPSPEDVFADGADDLLSVGLNETLRHVGGEYRPVVGPSAPSARCSVSGFDMEAGQSWIYPANMPFREYQYKISHQALFYNTLVTLPTGLGKTFIAAVVMYNFYRWFPNGKVIFMAPTKPLVAQQVEACFNIMGIPQEDVSEMTGGKLPAKRKEEWAKKRIFFLTPQVMANDLSRSACPAEQVKCIVVDEAHRATGNHAYCQVIRDLLKYTKQFRVLALSATPGPDIQTVQQVISNLLIKHLEIRVEDSIDIRPYTFQKQVEKIIVPMPPETKHFIDEYIQVMDVYINSLTSERLLFSRNVKNYSKCFILQQREKFRESVNTATVARSFVGSIECQFAALISLYHGYELMTMHGLRSLYQFLLERIFGEQGHSAVRRELMQNAAFCNVFSYLRDNFERSPADDVAQVSDFDSRLNQVRENAGKSHPKLVKLVELLVEHFLRCRSESRSSRAIIFTSFRDSVAEITTLLEGLSPLVKPVKFVGQNMSRGTARGITQKEQLKAVQDFQKGEYNTLVATCVGEEGLDIGEVDLIVCYDAPTSPVRLVQRMGRTGRQRTGRVISLVAEGKEEQMQCQSVSNQKRIDKAIINNKKFIFFTNNPRMIPFGVTPTCIKMHMSQHKSYVRNSGVAARRAGAQLRKETGVLTDEQFVEYVNKFHIDTPFTTLMTHRPLLSLQEKAGPAVIDAESLVEEQHDLSTYYLWQDRDNIPCFHSGHSSFYHLFVKLSKKCAYLSKVPEELHAVIEEDFTMDRSDEAGDLVFESVVRSSPHQRHKYKLKQKVGKMTGGKNGIHKSCNIPQLFGQMKVDAVLKGGKRQGDLAPIEGRQFRLVRSQEHRSSGDVMDLVADIDATIEACFVNGQLKEMCLDRATSGVDSKVDRRCWAFAYGHNDCCHDMPLKAWEEAAEDWTHNFCPLLALRSAELELPTGFRVSRITSRQASPVSMDEEVPPMRKVNSVAGTTVPRSKISAVSPAVAVPAFSLFKPMSPTFSRGAVRPIASSPDLLFGDSEMAFEDSFNPVPFAVQLSPVLNQSPSSKAPQIAAGSPVSFMRSGEMHGCQRRSEPQLPALCVETLSSTNVPKKELQSDSAVASGSMIAFPHGAREADFTTPVKRKHERTILYGAIERESLTAPPAPFSSMKRVKSRPPEDEDPFAISCDLFDDDDDFVDPLPKTMAPSVLKSESFRSKEQPQRRSTSEVIQVPAMHKEAAVFSKKSEEPHIRPQTEASFAGSAADDSRHGRLLDSLPEYSFVGFDSDDSFELNFGVGFQLDCQQQANSGGSHDQPGQGERPVAKSLSLDQSNNSFAIKTSSRWHKNANRPLFDSFESTSTSSKIGEVTPPRPEHKARKASKENKRLVSEFIDSQAEVSQRGREMVSSDESDTEEFDIASDIDDSFVDHSSQVEFLTQHPLSPAEMKALYLKSIKGRSPVPFVDDSDVPSAAANRNSFLESFSDNGGTSDFGDGSEDDCFVVPNDFVEYETSDSGSEVTAMTVSPPKRRRVLIAEDDDGEDDENKVSGKPKKSGDDVQTVVNEKSSSPFADVNPSSSADYDASSFDQLVMGVSQVFRPTSNVGQFAKRAGNVPLAVVKPCFTSLSQAPMVNDEVTDDAAAKRPQKTVVLVNSLEIASAQHMVSILKTDYDIYAQVCSLDYCDYVVSTRMAVERQLVSEIEHPFQISRLWSRLQRLFCQFDQVAVIIEKDRVKTPFYKKRKDSAEETKELKHSKAVDALLVSLTLDTRVKVLYSDSVEDSAALLAQLAKQETARGNNIAVDLNLTDMEQHMFNFLTEVPGLSYVSALYVTKKVHSFSWLMQSTASDLVEMAKLKSEQAEALISFMNRTVDAELL